MIFAVAFLVIILHASFLVKGTDPQCKIQSDALSGFDKTFDWNRVPILKGCLKAGVECFKGEGASENSDLKEKITVKNLHCYVAKECGDDWKRGKLYSLLDSFTGIERFQFRVEFSNENRTDSIQSCLFREQKKTLTANEYTKKVSLADAINITMASYVLINKTITELEKKHHKEFEDAYKIKDNEDTATAISKWQTTERLRDNFRNLYPQLLNELPELYKVARTIPEYLSAVSRSHICSPSVDATWLTRHVSRALMLLMEGAANLQTQKIECEKEIQKNQKNLKNAALKKLRNDVRVCKSDTESLSEIIRRKNDTISGLKTKARDSFAQIQKLVQEKNDCTELNAELKALNESITEQVYNLGETVANLTMRMKIQNERLSEKNKDLEEQFLELKKSNISLSEENAELKTRIQKLKDRLEGVKDDLKDQNLTLSNKISNLTAKIDNLTSVNADLRRNVTKLNTRSQELEDSVNMQSLKISVLKHQISNMTAEISQLNQTISNMSAGISDLEGNVSNANALNAHLKRNLSHCVTKLESRRQAKTGFREYDEKERMQDKDSNGPRCDCKVSKNVVSKNSFIVAIFFLCMFVVTTLFLLGHIYFVKVFKNWKSGDKTESSDDAENTKRKPPRKTTDNKTWPTTPKRKGVGANGKRPRKEKSTKETIKESSQSDWIADVSRVTSRDQKEVTLSKPLSTRRSERSRSVIPTIPLH